MRQFVAYVLMSEALENGRKTPHVPGSLAAALIRRIACGNGDGVVPDTEAAFARGLREVRVESEHTTAIALRKLVVKAPYVADPIYIRKAMEWILSYR